ncbi:hypothetical protein [Lyngbya sp. CCY1209]|uniref:hypothetical protein n=1 Tax=Lyngbya sp. CCY1209 TaxID=2886103 RepID=UPI002D1FDA06|nr:hypothetical protein [Lyngbya sp. CCY1209]MEB3882680.1 hypothetical protein [Lyngbya sp. CCY1209]
MKIIQTKATLKNGELFLNKAIDDLPQDEREVEVVILFKEPHEEADFDRVRAEMQAGFKEAGIETREQVLELIRDVKQEMFRERR